NTAPSVFQTPVTIEKKKQVQTCNLAYYHHIPKTCVAKNQHVCSSLGTAMPIFDECGEDLIECPSYMICTFTEYVEGRPVYKCQ
ncbi:hypothetical protein C0J52_16253, partial [Blattella germanica]